MTASIAILRIRAMRRVDEAAGAARLKYITDVPGQQAVYLRKREQAVGYLAALQSDPAALVPSYIAAEAQATGVTAQQLALSVMAVAALWDDTISPAMEAARIGGKRAIALATSEAGVEAAEEGALSTLQGL